MEANEKTVSAILTEQIRYVIPPYQRPYSWETANVEQFLADIWDAYEAKDDEYFIGSLITIEKQKAEIYEVVDGQQRLTTLNLILSRLRDHISDQSAKDELGKRVLPRNPLTGEEASPRLSLRQRDQNFFRRHVLMSETISPATRKDIEQARDAPKIRIAENLFVIDDFLTGLGDYKLKLLANFLLTKVYVVLVTTTSFHSAYRLFNVLNARGMPLSNSDLIKNLLFAKLDGSSEDSSDLESRWLELEEIVGIDRLDLFLGHHRATRIPEKARKSLHEEYEPMVKAAKDAFAFTQDLIVSAKNYARIHDEEFADPIALRALRSLKRVAFEEWTPALMAFLNQPIDGLEEQEFIVLLEKVTYQNWVRRLGFTARLTVYFRLIVAINSRQPADHIRGIFERSADNSEFKSLLNGDIYGKAFAKAVLLRLEEADQDISVTKNFGGKITIEHVLPQSLKDPYWAGRFGEELHKLWLHKLGNLALLHGIKNYQAQNYDFPRKQKIYQQRNNKVSFDTTKPIIEAQDWSASEIKARQEKMVANAMRVWGIE